MAQRNAIKMLESRALELGKEQQRAEKTLYPLKVRSAFLESILNRARF